MQSEEAPPEGAILLALPDNVQKHEESLFFSQDQTVSLKEQADDKSKHSAELEETVQCLNKKEEPSPSELERQSSHVSQRFSKSRKYTLLAVFSCAQFLGE